MLCCKHFHERSAELQIPRLPRISCRTWWRWRTSCAFLYGKAHTRPCLAQRGRKSGYARDDKGEGHGSMESGCWTEAFFITFGGPQARPFCPATALYGSATLPFVIPSAAEGSAVQRTFRGNVFDRAKQSGPAVFPIPEHLQAKSDNRPRVRSGYTAADLRLQVCGAVDR